MGEAAQIPSSDNPLSKSRSLLHFGMFEADFGAGELRKNGLKVKLYGQPFQVLAALLERPGEVVSREDLHERLWAKDTFVDFEHGLNKAINKVREALGDSADNPRFIETLPRKGYRFIASVRSPLASQPTTAVAPVLPELVPIKDRRTHGHPWSSVIAAALVTVIVIAIALNVTAYWRRRLAFSLGVRSIAVLPLVNLSHDQEQGFFADGMTEALITDLGKAGSLRVISHTSVNHYKNTQLPIPQIARELQVDAIVEGTVMRSGDRVRVTANLIQALPEKHLWADAYERDLRDVLAMQDEVAASITREVQTKSALPQAASKPVNPEAYQEYLWGRRLYERFSYDGEFKALEHLDRAIALDPNFALAYATRAEAYVPLVAWGAVPPRESLAKAEADARKAASLDDTLTDAHLGMAGVHVMRTEWAEAEQEFQRAIALNPSNYMAHDWHSYLLGDIGNHERELAELNLAYQLDPVSEYPHKAIALRYLAAGRYDEAIVEAQKALELSPAFDVARWILARSYEEQRKYPEAIAEFQKLGGGSSLAHAYALAGNKTKSRAILRELQQRAKTQYVSHRTFAIIRVGLGDNDAAIGELEKADQDGESFEYINQDSRYNPLRSNPRFEALLRRHGLSH